MSRITNAKGPLSGRGHFERREELAYRLSASQHGWPGESLQARNLTVIEEALRSKRMDHRRPSRSMRPVVNLHRDPHATIQDGRTEQALGASFGDDVRRGLHQRRIGSGPPGHQVWLRAHG